jgi:hypothetical protein
MTAKTVVAEIQTTADGVKDVRVTLGRASHSTWTRPAPQSTTTKKAEP